MYIAIHKAIINFGTITISMYVDFDLVHIYSNLDRTVVGQVPLLTYAGHSFK